MLEVLIAVVAFLGGYVACAVVNAKVRARQEQEERDLLNG